MNRISSAATQATSGTDCWGQSFSPDPLANLNTISVTQCSAGSLSVTVDGNNHITTSGFAYDAAGNMTQDGTPSVVYSFEAGNRLYKASGVTGGPYCYIYDGNGLRVAKKSAANSDCTGGTIVKLYWRSLFGDTLAESDGSGSTTNSAYNEYVFFTGRRVGSRSGSGAIVYWFADQLGTTRSNTDASGNVCYDADYTPYGQEIAHTNTCAPNYKFTGYERDAETSLDYAFARYYSSRLGRFMSADPLGGDLVDPQSLNRYAYVRNSPLGITDPTGMGLWTSCWVDPWTGYCALPFYPVGGGGGGGGGAGCDPIADPTCGGGFGFEIPPTLGCDPNLDPSCGPAGLCDPGIDFNCYFVLRLDFLNLPFAAGGAANNNPCANATLSAAGVTAQQQIATAQGFIAAGEIAANANLYANPLLSFFGGMFGYYNAVKTGGPNDIKNLLGHSPKNPIDVDARNISFGITCPYGDGFCQFAAGLAQTLSGHPNFNGTLATGFDTPSDTAAIRVGQAMRAAGCHE